jgi:hypothetical protein
MTQFALATSSSIRNALFGTLATMALAACGGGSSGSSSTAAASADTSTTTALVAPNVGMIDRSQGSDSNESASSVATGASGTTSASNTATTTTTLTTAPTTVAKVTPPINTVNGVATLDWLPPTENNDGSALTNLAGYTVYYGTDLNDLSQSVKVSNPGLASYSVTGLASGTWYFAVTSYSADGAESARTTTVSTRI